MLLAGLGALIVLAVAVSATQLSGDERVAICHATASEANPYVLILAKKDGFEHGHHRHHDGDFFTDNLEQGCTGDVPVVPDEGNGTSEPTEPEVPADPETPEDNATSPPANETPVPDPVDVAVRQAAVQDDFAVTLTLRVANVGPGLAQQVSLDDQLPDVRRSWQLAGIDAADCVLDGRSLSCWFGDLPAGEERVVELRSFTDRMPCGFALTNTAFVAALDDAEARNDASSASIAARAC